MQPSSIQAIGVLAALVFCVVRTFVDLRARRIGWAVAGAVICALLLWASLVPIPTHAVKVDLPVNY